MCVATVGAPFTHPWREARRPKEGKVTGTKNRTATANTSSSLPGVQGSRPTINTQHSILLSIDVFARNVDWPNIPEEESKRVKDLRFESFLKK